MNSLTLNTISWLHRNDIEDILVSKGHIIQTTDNDEKLKELLIGDIESGEILESELL